MSSQLRYNGKFIKKKVLERKQNCHIGLKKYREEDRNLIINQKQNIPFEGNRLVDFRVLSQNMQCKNCNKPLLLDDIVGEIKKGLHSILIVKCRDCSTNFHVETGNYHKVNENAKQYISDQQHNDNTSKAVLGAYHAGVGCTQLNKILACLDLPLISNKLFRKYEQEVGPIIEECAKASCDKAAKEEKQLVLDKLEELKEDMPEEIRDEFYSEVNRIDSDSDAASFDGVLGRIVYIIISYDMGWSKRGNGRSYNSMNGYGAIIGFFTKKVLDYRTRNKKCRLCDLGKSLESHDCRKNCFSSSKAMEADVGAELVLRSDILKNNCLKVKVINGDEDSSLMARINKEKPDNKIHKLADSNHVKKNLSKKLYSLKTKYSELGRKGMITHIKKCFSYALAQNKGNSAGLKATVNSISDHLYNNHENCGDWCSRKTGLHKSKFILKNGGLYNELKHLFSTYANNAFKYCVNSSSQANEAFNNSVAHKFPKNKSYSTSPSGDTRVATAVLTTNEGDSFMINVKKQAGVAVSHDSIKYYKNLDKHRLSKSITSKAIEKKRRRLKLCQDKENVRKVLETSEGNTYKSNMAFESNEINFFEFNVNIIKNLSPDNCQLVYFDLETSGRVQTSDILQIAAIVDTQMFSVYIKPTQPIDQCALKVNGLVNIDGELYLRKEKVETMTMSDALCAFYTFLRRFARKCLLVAHNAAFDKRYLLRELNRHKLYEKFSAIIYGFCDTLQLFRQTFPDRKMKGMCTLSQLAKDFIVDEITTQQKFHDASYDVIILQKLVQNKLSIDIVFQKSVLFKKSVKQFLQNQRTSQKAQSFVKLEGIITNYMIKKIALTGTSYCDLEELFKKDGENAIVSFLTGQENKKARVTKDKKIISVIVDHFKNNAQQ